MCVQEYHKTKLIFMGVMGIDLKLEGSKISKGPRYVLKILIP